MSTSERRLEICTGRPYASAALNLTAGFDFRAGFGQTAPCFEPHHPRTARMIRGQVGFEGLHA